MTGPSNHHADTERLFDELLVTLVQTGDRRATERLAIRWQPRFARTARRLIGDEDLALNIVQDTWIAILRSISSLREPSRFAAWAFGILHRRCADQIRDLQKRRSIESDAKLEPKYTSGLEEGLTLLQAFAALPLEQRLTAQLFYAEGLTLAQIADVQAIPLGTAKTRLFHARRKLKATLKGDET